MNSATISGTRPNNPHVQTANKLCLFRQFSQPVRITELSNLNTINTKLLCLAFHQKTVQTKTNALSQIRKYPPGTPWQVQIETNRNEGSVVLRQQTVCVCCVYGHGLVMEHYYMPPPSPPPPGGGGGKPHSRSTRIDTFLEIPEQKHKKWQTHFQVMWLNSMLAFEGRVQVDGG